MTVAVENIDPAAGAAGLTNQSCRMMFLCNDEKIDTEILRDRVVREISSLKRQMTDGPAATAPLGKSGLALQKAPPRSDNGGQIGVQQQLTRKVSTWIWCFVHLPRIYTMANSTKLRLSAYEQQMGTLQGHVQRHELSLVDLQTVRDRKFRSGAKSHRLKREIMFQQRRLTRLGEMPSAETHTR